MRRNVIVLFTIMISMLSAAQEVITMRNDNGVYTIPCTVNGLRLRFIFDTGAADVSISAAEALFMLKNEYLSLDDIVDSENYTLADGTILENTIINIPEIKIGSKTLTNVRACVVKNINAPLLLGQSAIKQLGAWYIEGDKLIFGKPSEQSSNSVVSNTPIEKCIEEAKKYESYGDYETAVELFQKACTIENFLYYHEFALFCARNLSNYEKCSLIMPYEGVCKAAIKGYQPMVDFIKSYPSIFKYDSQNALRYYSQLIDSGMWFLCTYASDFCAFTLNNRSKALEFVIKGAEHNDKKCILRLGHLYDPLSPKLNGYELVVEDKETAMKWYKKAVAFEDDEAMRLYAMLLLDDENKTTETVDLAFSYLIKAGNLGNAWAINTLMTEFFIGDKTPLNYEKALYWAKKLDKPNNRFYENACELMGIIYYEQGKYDNAFSYLRNTEKECLSPFPTVYLYLADCYFFGYGTSINYTYAIKNYIRLIDAFENDNWQATDDAIYAYKKLAYMYEEGLGVDQDFSRAFSYYMKAANYGDYFAASIVADYYFNGNRIEQDINRAIFWFEKSAQQNDAYSWYSLGWIYAREKFGHYNTSKAVECFNKAIKCDNDGTNSSSCYYELGRIYEYGGGGISKSYAKAGTYYKKAAELGHDKAKEKMKEFE